MATIEHLQDRLKKMRDYRNEQIYKERNLGKTYDIEDTNNDVTDPLDIVKVKTVDEGKEFKLIDRIINDLSANRYAYDISSGVFDSFSEWSDKSWKKVLWTQINQMIWK